MQRRQGTDRPRTARTTVTLEREQIAKLSHLANEYGIPVSQIVRYSVGRVLGDPLLLLGLVHAVGTQHANGKNAQEPAR